MKIFRIIKNINSGNIWLIPIENFLADSEFRNYTRILNDKGFLIINDLFPVYKKNDLEEVIMSLDIEPERKIGLFNYINNEFGRLDKISKFKKTFLWSAIGILILIIPFIVINSYGKYDHSISALETGNRNFVYPFKLILLSVYSIIILILYKVKNNILIINILILAIILTFMTHIWSFLFIISSNSILEELKITVYPTIGLIGSTVVNFIVIRELSNSKQIIKSELRKPVDLTY